MKTSLIVAITVAIALTSVLRADEPKPVKLTLHPMAEPTPALKYRLLPAATEQISGNAAVHYGKVTAEQWAYFRKYVHTDVMDEWEEMPLEKVRTEKIPIPSASVFFLEQGAKSKYCDWQLPIGQMPFYEILLPDIQQTRSYARILAVKARVAIAKRNFDEAVKTFQTGYALGTNVAMGETLINGLVGIAINGIMFPQITEYVQQPGAPNLYWAFTVLPSPLINMRPALDIETNSLELSFPEFRDLSSAERTPNEWRELFIHFIKQLDDMYSRETRKPHIPTPADLDAACKKILPIAKRALTERGISAKKVEAMSTHQAALMYWLQLQRELTDEYVKAYALPYPQAIQGIKSASLLAERAKADGRDIIALSSLMLPVMEATRTAVVRDERRIAVLRVIEALRLHAASNGGKLPDQLSDISEVPIPEDPVTTKPFDYRRDGDKAVLQGPTLDGVPLNYEITMAPAK